ncbi:penicillin-binding transpeptidase domain-containing protein [Proteiniborus sp. MB09-C3]|uniref:penicillin-binding transpeptidase domain-containing protein n=1 Tax=Proteiniborus sp. MB09-C3 TaxID=3050072 RepID=UPI0025576CEA|nr:penicillin-binding transpeptidase domain-containing protein [Proteiniborus sp. MB09-C3]WIV10600.1 penicillin-binding transpeptidase domain-containing protein [Proteiniborus sp. MB09-C3]
MKFWEKIKDRYNIFIFLTTLIFVALAFKLAALTIVEGEEMRRTSNSKRVKQISITASRGEIRDRYGRLLAGNNPSFTVQIMKDELNIKDTDKRNSAILKLVRILDDEGVNYIDEFPIDLNHFSYNSAAMYMENSKTPYEYVTELILNNNLVEELINSTMRIEDDTNSRVFFTARRAVNVLENEGISMPIKIDFNEEKNISFNYDTNVDIEKWQKENNIPNGKTARDILISKIIENKKVLMKLINNPIVSELTYEVLQNNGLANDISLEPYSFSFDEEYKSIKRNLMKSFGNITIDSSATDDFVNIVLQTEAKYEILSNIFVKGSDEEKNKEQTIPGQILINKLNEKNIDIPVNIVIDEEESKVSFKYKSDEEKERFYKNEKIEGELTAIEALIYIAEKHNVITDFITDDKIKSIAQEKVLGYVNPKISISTWEYAVLNNKKSWLETYNVPKESSAKEAFEFLTNKYKIEEGLNKYEARSIMLVLEQLNKQGHRAYQPINLAYGIRNSTVAKLEENKFDLLGVGVSIEPIRYYPNGETAAHILGYLGKISQTNEIKKYIEEQGYSPNDIIGKTGVEDSFEQYLKGKNGSRRVEVDVLGNTIKVLDEVKPIPGNNLYLTLDLELQKVAEDALKQAIEQIQIGGEFQSKWGNYKFPQAYKNATSGAVVAINVKTGEILALANYPAYDPNLFVTGISDEDWRSLMPEHEEDPLAPRPLYNISLQTAIQPGSIFKMITGLAAQEKGISSSKKIYDYGVVEIGNGRFGCWYWNDYGRVHGWVNLAEAIRDSCNYYFYSVTMGRNPKTGEGLGGKVDIEDILRVAKEFGLDDKTGIEIAGERAVGVPDTNLKTNNTKIGLRRFLNTNIRDFIKEGAHIDEKDISKIIDEIVSWAEFEEPLSKREVVRRLDKLNINGEKKLEGSREDLADVIKYTYLNQSGWKQADTLNISIGQGQNAYTPIQMANYMATLANGGYRHNASVISKAQNHDNSEIVYEPKRESDRVVLKDYNFINEVNKGLGMVTSDGTSRAIFKDFPVKVATKTGTAQNSGTNPATGEKYDNYAWFAAYGPYEENNPEAAEIAVVGVIFQGGTGGYVGPIAKEIIAQYLGLNYEANDEFTVRNKLAK